MILVVAAVVTICFLYLILLSRETCTSAIRDSQGYGGWSWIPILGGGSEREHGESAFSSGPWSYGACTEVAAPTSEWGRAMEGALSSGSIARVFELRTDQVLPVGRLVQVRCGDALVLGEVIGSRRCDSGTQLLVQAGQFIRGSAPDVPADGRASAAKGEGRCCRR